MKRFLMLILTVSLISVPCILFVTCSKKTDSPSALSESQYSYSASKSGNATITGIDSRDCPCCGGYFLTIDNNKPIAGDYFLTYEFPGGFKPQKYPLRVSIEWKKDANACVNDKITITRITVLAN